MVSQESIVSALSHSIHTKHAGLEAECSEYEIRLGSDDYSGSAAGLFTEEGSSELEVVSGRVELCVDGAWTSLCTDHWNFSSAAVACSQLGYPSIG